MPMRTISTALPVQGFDDSASPMTEGMLHAASTLWSLQPQLDQIKLDRQKYADSQNEAAAQHGVASGNNTLWDSVANRVQSQQDAATKAAQDQRLWERQHQTNDEGFRALQESDRMDEAQQRLAEQDLANQSLDRYREGRIENTRNGRDITDNELWERATGLAKLGAGSDVLGHPRPVSEDQVQAIADRLRSHGQHAVLPQPPHSAETNPAARHALDILEPGGAGPQRAPVAPSLSSPGHPAFSSPGPAAAPAPPASPGLWGTSERPGAASGGNGTLRNTPQQPNLGPHGAEPVEDTQAPPEWQAARLSRAGMDQWAQLYQQEPAALHNASPEQVQAYAQQNPQSFTGQMFRLKAAGDPRYKVILQELARRGVQ